MSNPLRAPQTPAIAESGAPSAYFTPGARYESWTKAGKKVEFVQRELEGLDMTPANSFYLPKELCVEPAVLGRKGPAFALACGGRPHFRVRSALAFGALSSVYRELPSAGFGAEALVGEAVKDRFFVEGGTECTLGRLRDYYPRAGSSTIGITKAEAEAALDNCGMRVSHLPAHALRPAPLVAREGEQAVMINKKSGNGFPVLGKWDTPGASERCLGLAVALRKELTAASRGGPHWAEEFLRKGEAERPFLFALQGKAKADYYAARKIEQAQLRFYNVFPRHVMLNMQVATQALEAVSRNILQEGHSGIGVSLVHGGAEKLVVALEDQLASRGYAYVHVGDDSFVVVKEGKRLLWFALDCSSFDLTQHAETTLQVHQAVRRQLECVDLVAAGLWYAYARQRRVVVCGALVYDWKHAGPSGMPLQSKVNDMLMDVLINRVLDGRQAGWDEDKWDSHIQRVGTALGFKVRVEQFAEFSADTIRGALEEQPFLFVGYYFHVREGRVRVCADLPRTLAQMPYPGLKWMASKQEVQVMEAMRLGSMLLSAGLPARGLDRAFEAWRFYVLDLLDRAMALAGDVRDERLRWAVGEGPHGPPVEASLSGLRRALLRPPEELWLVEERELPSTSELVPSSGATWADEVEGEERRDALRAGGWVPPPMGALPGPRFVAGEAPPTHPTTRRNHGRPPPTARWGPNKTPAEGPRVRRRGRVVEEDEESEEYLDEEDSRDDHDDGRYSDESSLDEDWGLR